MKVLFCFERALRLTHPDVVVEPEIDSKPQTQPKGSSISKMTKPRDVIREVALPHLVSALRSLVLVFVIKSLKAAAFSDPVQKTSQSPDLNPSPSLSTYEPDLRVALLPSCTARTHRLAIRSLLSFNPQMDARLPDAHLCGSRGNTPSFVNSLLPVTFTCSFWHGV